MNAQLKRLARKAENSPFYRLLDIRIEEVKEKYSRLSIEIDRKHVQLLNTVHGGVMASLADSAAAWAVFGSSSLEGTPVTIEMKINFLIPVKSGKLVAEARNVYEGSRIFVGDVDVSNGKGELVAKSLVTYYILKEP